MRPKLAAPGQVQAPCNNHTGSGEPASSIGHQEPAMRADAKSTGQVSPGQVSCRPGELESEGAETQRSGHLMRLARLRQQTEMPTLQQVQQQQMQLKRKLLASCKLQEPSNVAFGQPQPPSSQACAHASQMEHTRDQLHSDQRDDQQQEQEQEQQQQQPLLITQPASISPGHQESPGSSCQESEPSESAQQDHQAGQSIRISAYEQPHWACHERPQAAHLLTTAWPEMGPASASQEPVARPRAQQAGELSIQTGRLRVKDMVAAMDASVASSSNSALSTPSASVLSDSTTLITEAAMNSAELIPKLVERLDRKLIVMKEEQLSLMREIELNEATGQRLFESMKEHLTVNEYEKISLHANEIEKVTKLILSLKLRLKRVEAELKERANQQRGAQAAPIQQQQQQSQTQGLQVTGPPADPQRSTSASSLSAARTRTAGSQAAQATRGVSDPTSTTGLPNRRNHQHHASLQPGQAPAQSASAGQAPGRRSSQTVAEPSPTESCKNASTSSDSIFNCADSAIGSTITGHGGSAISCVEQANSLDSRQSAVGVPAHRAQAGLESPAQSHLSSSISVASSGSMSSVPSSPALVSPLASGCLGASVSASCTPTAELAAKPGQGLAKERQTNEQPSDELQVGHLLTDTDILVAKRNKLVAQLEEAHQLEECIVRRNNVIIERILKKYYEDGQSNSSNSGNEISEFRQFTRLKSLLLKDTHDVADRIDSAESQLTELKQSSQSRPLL